MFIVSDTLAESYPDTNDKGFSGSSFDKTPSLLCKGHRINVGKCACVCVCVHARVCTCTFVKITATFTLSFCVSYDVAERSDYLHVLD